MLFLLKRTCLGGLAGLVVLTLAGLGLRQLVPDPPPINLTLETVAQGVLVVGLVLGSDGLIHGGLLLLGGERYRRRHAELRDVFRGQSYAAILLGAAMAGVGEELVFRGLGRCPLYLGMSAVVFGLLHHIRASLWPFTLWAVWQGLLFAAALYCTGVLGVTMVAHFLHDTTGFLVFRFLRWRCLR